jgi:[acyl-carrier-protein] S-malonyltransferase
VVAGHSLGELTALVAAGAISFEDGLRLVRERGRLMKAADEQSPGAMAALLGLNADVVNDICARAREQTGGVLVLANDNCPGQVVISGDDATLDVALALAKDAKVKKAVKLQISIAAHSPLMEPAAAEFRRALAGVACQTPQIPVYGNLTAAPLVSVDDIRAELDAQLTGAVRWTESVQAMIAAGVDQFIELGPKDVLVGLLKRIDRRVSGFALNSRESLRHLVDEPTENP